MAIFDLPSLFHTANVEDPVIQLGTRMIIAPRSLGVEELTWQSAYGSQGLLETKTIRNGSRGLGLLGLLRDGTNEVRYSAYAIVQTRKDTQFEIVNHETGAIQCTFYYQSDSDNILLPKSNEKSEEVVQCWTTVNGRTTPYQCEGDSWVLLPHEQYIIKIEQHAFTILVLPRPQSRRLSPSHQSEDVTRGGDTIQPLAILENGITIRLPRTGIDNAYDVTRKSPISDRKLLLYLATVNGHDVVVKTTKKPWSASQSRAYCREYERLKGLDHEHIVKLIDIDARYLAMYLEHIAGSDLARYDTEHKSIVDQSLIPRILKDVASAVAYLHNQGVTHNDIKPDNILFCLERGAVLCDFDMATLEVDSRDAGGTCWYVPAEGIGRGPRGKPADIWALGMTTLYLRRFIPRPDHWRIEGRELYWHFPDVYGRPGGEGVEKAARFARAVGYVVDSLALDQFSKPTPLYEIVVAMLAENPKDRIDATELAERASTLLKDVLQPSLEESIGTSSTQARLADEEELRRRLLDELDRGAADTEPATSYF